VSWRLVVRAGPRVERERHPTLGAALDALERRARRLSMGPGLEAVEGPLGRRYAPGDRVAARLEVTGPQRLRPDVRAGLDVRGDGTAVAWTGGRTRAELTPGEGESPYDALRRCAAPGSSTSEDP
jgi:hypothetical protein